MSATRFINLPSPFKMQRGGELHGAKIAYETWGELNPDKSNAVLILTGLSPSAHAAANSDDPSDGWWEPVVGAGKPIDSDKFFVICVNSLGSCMGSTGPASVDPASGKAYALSFPDLTLEDIAHAAYEVLAALNIGSVAALVGPSMGGMSAQAFALLYPGFANNVALISTAAHALPFAIGIRSLQREAIRTDPLWNAGNYSAASSPVNGMRMARKIGVVTYRSAQEWRERFGRQRTTNSASGVPPFGIEFEIEAYLEALAEKFVGGFDPNSYIYLSRAMDWFDVLDYGSSFAAAFAQSKIQKALVIGVTTDILFPLSQQTEIANALKANGTQVEFAAIPSIQGHDSFLVDYERFCPVIASFMQSV